jgi:hypothetical protein
MIEPENFMDGLSPERSPSGIVLARRIPTDRLIPIRVFVDMEVLHPTRVNNLFHVPISPYPPFLMIVKPFYHQSCRLILLAI